MKLGAGLRNLAIMAAAAVLGRAVWFSNMSPHGVATFAASWEAWPSERLTVFLGVLIGSLAGMGWTSVLKIGSALICATIILTGHDISRKRIQDVSSPQEAVRRHLRRRARQRGVGLDPGLDMLWPALAAMGSMGSVNLVQAALTVSSPKQVVVWATESLSSGILAALFVPGLAQVRCLIQGRSAAPITSAEVTSGAMLLVSLLCGLRQIRVLGIPLREVVSATVTMMAAFAGGPGVGAATGLLSGMVPILEGSKVVGGAARCAFGGLVAGGFKQAGKVSVAVCYILAAGMVWLYSGSISEAGEGIIAMVLGGMGFLAVPRGLTMNVFSSRMASALQAHGDASTTPESNVPSRTITRLKELSVVMRELSRAYEQVGATLEESTGLVPPAYADLACRVCQTCVSYKPCWEAGFFTTYRSFLDLLAIAETSGGLTIENVPESVRLTCKRLTELVAAVNYVVELNRVNVGWRERLRESRAALVSQAKGIASAMDRLVRELGDRNCQEEEGSRAPKYVTGVSRRTRAGGIVSGDYYLVKELNEGRLLLVLSDGMGSGPKAALEARSVVTLLERLLEAGFDRDSALQSVNSLMVMRSRDDTFATLDIAILNLRTAEADFIKVGAAPSFLKRGSEVTVIRSHSLPVGVTCSVEVETVQKLMLAGDILVMATDGVVSSRRDPEDGHEQWLCSFLSRLRCDDPEEIAAKLIDKAMDNWRKAGARDVPDDMTVLVTKLSV
ncbi:MAG: SpoIIE family protein phosphatase [Bacillota bacterium]